MRTPPLSAGPKILGPAAHCMATMGVPTTTSTTPTSSMICQSSKGWQIVCLRPRRRLCTVGGVGWSCTIHDMAEISSYDHTPKHLHRDAPPYTIPEGTLIVNCLIMLTHNHEEEDGSHFLFVPSSSSGSLNLGWRGLCHSRGALPFFLMPLMSTGGRGFPRPPPWG